MMRNQAGQRGLYWVALVVSLFMLVDASFGSPPTTAPSLDEHQPLQLVLLIGQSNMAGRGKIEPEDEIIHPRVWALNKDMQWVPAKDPIHFDKPKVAGVGPGTTFGRLLADSQPESFVGLIPCAVGGTSISQWKKGGELYENAVKRTKAAMARGQLRAILWHQGEADCAADHIAAYPQKFKQLVSDLRSDLQSADVPFICGQLGEFHSAKAPLNNQFNEMLVRLATEVFRCKCATSQGLRNNENDDSHYNSMSQRELGRRYFNCFTDVSPAQPAVK